MTLSEPLLARRPSVIVDRENTDPKENRIAIMAMTLRTDSNKYNK